jgi:hypothetical protein
MTPNQTTPVSPPDRLDRLFSDFFKNELPQPWPAPPIATRPSVLSRDRAADGSRSRYTLAASVAMLLGLGVYLSSTVPGGQPIAGDRPSNLLNKAEAEGKKMLHHANPMPAEDHPIGMPDMP